MGPPRLRSAVGQRRVTKLQRSFHYTGPHQIASNLTAPGTRVAGGCRMVISPDVDLDA